MNEKLISLATGLDRVYDGKISPDATAGRFATLIKLTLDRAIDNDEFIALAQFIPELDYRYIYA